MREEPEKVECPLGIKAIEFGEMIQSIKTMAEDVKEIKQGVKDQNGRTRKLEINQGKIFAVVTVIAFLVPLLLEYVF